MLLIKLLTILLTFQILSLQDIAPNELRYYLHYDDIFTTKISDLLDYEDFLDDLTFESTQNLDIASPVSMTKNDSETLWENEDGVYTSEKPEIKIKKVYDSGDFKNFNAYLVGTKKTNNLLIISELTKENNSDRIILKNRIYQFVDPSFVCDEILMDEEHIYSSCISKRDRSIQLCTKNYKKNTLSSCRFFNVDFEIKEQQLGNSQLGIEIFTNNDGIKLFFIFFRRSLVIEFQNKLLLVTNDSYKVLEIPIKDFIIDTVKVVSYRKETEIISCLISNLHGELIEVYSLKIQSGIIDKNYLAQGLIKDNLIGFNSFGNLVIFYEEDIEANLILLTELNLDTLTDRVIKIEKQQKILRTDLGHNLAIIQTRNNNFMKSIFFYDISTERIFEIDLKLQDHEKWSIISIYQKNVFFIFDEKNLNFNIYLVSSVRSIIIKNPKENRLENAYIVFKVRDKPVLNLNLHYINFEDIWVPPSVRYYVVKGKKNLVKITGIMNDMVITSKNGNEIDYFGQLETDFFDSKNYNCDYTKVFFENDLLVFFCRDNKILLYSHIELTTKKISLIKPRTYTTNLDDLQKIKTIRFYYNHLLLIIDSDLNLSGVIIDKNNLKDETLNFVTINLKIDYDLCKWNQQGLVCYKDEDVYHVSIEYQKGFISLTTNSHVNLKKIAGSKYNFFNSYFNKSFYYILKKDEFFDEYNFRKATNGNNVIIESYDKFLYPLNEKTEILYITYETYLIITKRVTELELFILHSNNRLKLPVENYIKDFKEVIMINNFPIEHLVVIFYRTNQNTVRALLYKATLEANNRLIKEFLVDEGYCKKPIAYSRSYGVHDFLISYCCSDEGKNDFKIFRYNTNGPVLIVGKDQEYDELTFGGGDMKSVFNFIVNTKGTSLEVSGTNVIIGKNKKKIMLFDLEKENIFIEGDHFNTKTLELPNGVTILKRVNKISELELENTNISKRPYFNIETGYLDDRLMVIFGDYIYSNKKKEFNNSYTDCVHVFPSSVMLKDRNFFSKIFICRKRDNFIYYLTNLDDFNFEIDSNYISANINVINPFLVKHKNMIYVIFTYSLNCRILKILKLSYGGPEDTQLIFSSDVYPDIYHRKFVGFESYFPYYDEVSNSILIIMHPRYSSEFMILKFNLKENKVDAKDVSYIEFHEGRKVNMYRVYYFEENKNFRAFVTTSYYIYELQLEFEYEWKLRIVNKFFNYFGNSKGDEKITFNKEYLAITSKTKENKINILIWKRTSKEKIKPIYSTIGLSEINSYDYLISRISLDHFSENNILSVIFYEERNNEFEEYKSLKLVSFEISTLRLKLDLEEMKYKETLKLRFNTFDYKDQDVVISITLKENFKVILFSIAFLVLFALLILLWGLIVIVKIKNKELREELESMEESRMSDRVSFDQDVISRDD